MYVLKIYDDSPENPKLIAVSNNRSNLIPHLPNGYVELYNNKHATSYCHKDVLKYYTSPDLNSHNIPIAIAEIAFDADLVIV